MIGTKITKPVDDWQPYREAAEWCNANKAVIEDRGDYYEVVALPEQTLDEAKAIKLTEINSACDKVLHDLVGTYPALEIFTFEQQLADARAYTADNTAETPVLSKLAVARGVELPDLVNRVLEKAEHFKDVSARAVGQRQALEDQLNAAKTSDDVTSLEEHRSR